MPTIVWWILGLAAAGTAGYVAYDHFSSHETHDQTGPSCPSDAQLTKMVLDIDSGKTSLAVADEWVKAYKDCPTTAGAIAQIVKVVRARTNAGLGTGTGTTVDPVKRDMGAAERIMPAVQQKVVGVGALRRNAPPWMGGPRRRAA